MLRNSNNIPIYVKEMILRYSKRLKFEYIQPKFEINCGEKEQLLFKDELVIAFMNFGICAIFLNIQRQISLPLQI